MADTKIFGVNLVMVMSRPSERTIPTFVKKIIRYLNSQAIDTESLFRISAKAAQMNVIKQKIDAGGIDDIDFFEYNDPHLIAGLLKLYLRELPEPLFTFELYPKFIEAATEYENACNLQRTKAGIVGQSDQDNAHTQKYIESLSKLVEDLPAANKALAEILLLFLNCVGEHSGNNKMSPANLAIVFGQILLRPEVETIESMMNASKITGIMKFVIEKFDLIFPKQKALQRAAQSASSMGFDLNRGGGGQLTAEQEKLVKIKDTIDEAIILVQKKLNTLGSTLQGTTQLDEAIEIARRVRTAKKVLFPPGEEPTIRAAKNSGRHDDFEVVSAMAERQGKRKKMEDAYVIIDDLHSDFPKLVGDQRFAFYAVYDGHGGSDSSKMCGEKMHKHIVSQPTFSQMNFKEAIKKGFEATDKDILAAQEGAEKKDGSTAVVAFIFNRYLYIGNAGDSEALLVRIMDDGEVMAETLTEKHRPTDEKEKARIEKAGGAVFSGRVFGTLAVSRSLGDGDFKVPISDANFVSSEPFLNQIELKPEHHFLLLGCDGLFDKMTPQAVADIVAEGHATGRSVNQICNTLVDQALQRGSMDNVTVVLVEFKWKED
mmetsp:Transcript_15919/g.62203  ORF Transcript_15919/g.62203 Transcript_15919/m.62203 type:complete len:600 (-) Transcript_15919:85-1884(-)